MVWVLFINDHRRPIGSPVNVEVPPDATVDTLRARAKERHSDLAEVGPQAKLVVWRNTGQPVAAADDDDEEALVVNAFLNNQVTKLMPRRKLRELGLQEDEILFIETPGVFCAH
jgi:muconolactone delta-isomerase